MEPKLTEIGEKQKKFPKWVGQIDLAIWENDDGTLFLKIGGKDGIGIRLNKNEL